MIIPSNLLDKHFPWAMINLVIEYEYDKQATLLTICETQNIKLVSFKVKLSSSESSSQQGTVILYNFVKLHDCQLMFCYQKQVWYDIFNLDPKGFVRNTLNTVL